MLVQLNGVVILVTIEKPKDKDEIRNCMGIVVDLVDRSDEVVVGTMEKVTQTIVLLVAYLRSSEVMPKTRRVPEVCHGSGM